MTIIAIDTETVSLKNKTLIAYSICINGNDPIVEPVRMNTTTNATKEEHIEYLTQVIERKDNKIVFHNSSFDIPVLVQFGVPFKVFEKASKEGRLEDTLIMANLVDENIQHGLKPLTKKYFNYKMTSFKEVCGTGKHQICFADAPWDKAQHYAGEDAYWTYRLYRLLHKNLSKDTKSLEVYENIEKPLLIVVADMHVNGITIDVQKLKCMTEICNDKVSLLKRKLDITMSGINLNSPKQLRQFFIGRKRLPVIKTTATGSPSVDKEVLKQYAEKDGDAKMLLEYRKFNKILSTFIPALTPDEWDMDTWKGKIYASFNQAATSSGRFSSSNPNMQNMPNEDKYKDKEKTVINDDYLGLRECIIADEGHVLVGADYSQVELRVLAHVSQDFNLMKAYQEGKDIHQMTADACGVKRRPAKTINFGLVYGMGAKTLAKRINVSYDEAADYIERYFSKYPGIKDFWDGVEDEVRQRGYTRTCFGRKRRRTVYFNSKDDYDQGNEIRSITNAVIQGTSADMMKIAMINMYYPLKKLGARIVSTVHDEVIISTPKDKAKQASAIVHRAMVESGQSLSVPIEVDAKIGDSWNDIH